MTLLGKILTVCILIMSLVFMSFAIMVFSTHKNWKLVVNNPQSSVTASQPLGLKQQVEESLKEKKALQTELNNLRAAIARERAARTQALASLESRKLQIDAELTTTATLLAEKEAALGKAIETLRTTENQLVGLTDEVKGLRGEIQLTQGQRDTYFLDVVAKTDQVHMMQDIQARLEEREGELLAEVSRYKFVLDRKGIDPSIIPTQPPELDGYITAVSEDNTPLVEVSLGSDDGLREGHYLEVSRAGKYVGRLAVVRVNADRAVGQILKELLRSPMQRGDVVRTKVN